MSLQEEMRSPTHPPETLRKKNISKLLKAQNYFGEVLFDAAIAWTNFYPPHAVALELVFYNPSPHAVAF
jgi:hypothetical protein